MLLRPGDKVGRYRARERVGIGGMAEVWLVVHEVLGTRHALKVLLHASDDVRHRLVREGRAQSVLRHENLVPVRDILEFDGAPALLMPLIEGPSLSELLREYKPTLDEALALFAAILRGVGHAHDCGYIHRDLKPANVLLDLNDGAVVPRVTDFGLVKRHAGTVLTQMGVVMGTPAYAAPEQLADAASANESADLFSLGVMLVELVEGRRPFFGADVGMIRVAHGQPPNLGSMRGPLRELVVELLQIDPEARPMSCDEVLERLGRVDGDCLGSGALCRLVSAGVDRAQTGDASTGVPRGAVSEAPNNLPKRRDAFVGRRELRALLGRRLVGARRLLTLTGMGGSGKTRVALEFGRSVLPEMTGGVYWIDLTDARDLDGILAATGGALGLQLGEDPVGQLGHAIGGRGRCLLLFDNFEHLVALAPESLGKWLDQCEEARFLVTSRIPLQLLGETIVPVQPLDQSDAVELFAMRAVSANPDFELSASNLDAVGALVDLLDGLPLAVELAAARSRMYTPAKLVTRMTSRFRVLSRDSPELPERHRTLRATLQWSWDLLSLVERATLAQLSVFEGGFTLEACEAVIDLSAFRDAPWVEDVVATLLDHSLITLSKRGREPRFSMLASVKAFASARLERPEGAERRHGQFYAAMDTGRSPDADAEALYGREADNLIAACDLAIARCDAPVAARTALILSVVLSRRGTGVRSSVLLRTLDLEGHSPLLRARLLARLRSLSFIREVGGGRELHREALAILEGDTRPAAIRVRCLLWMTEARVQQRAGDVVAAKRRFEAALEGLERLDYPADQARVEYQLGKLHQITGDEDGAQRLFALALERSRAARLPRNEALTLGRIAGHLARLGNVEARGLWQRALALARENGDRALEVHLLPSLREFEHSLGLADDAERIQAEMQAARAWHEMGYVNNAGIYEGRAGVAFLLAGRADEASEWLRRSLKTLGPKGNSASRSQTHCYLARIALDRGDPEEARELVQRSLELGRGFHYAEDAARKLLAEVLAFDESD